MTNGISAKPRKNLVLIDGHAVAFHCWYTSDPNEVIEGFIDMLDDSLRKHRATHAVITFDPPPPVFRHHLYPDYKAGRPPVPEGFLEECEELRELLTDEGYVVVEQEGYEADDLIGTLSELAERSGFNTLISTCDLDLLQLVTENVSAEVFSQYWPTRMFDVEKTVTRFKGLRPGQIADYKALAGDRSDNLPGVPGIGDVTATVLLREKGSIEAIYQDLDSVSDLPMRGAVRTARVLGENKDQAFLMKRLTSIVRDVSLDVDLESAALRVAA